MAYSTPWMSDFTDDDPFSLPDPLSWDSDDPDDDEDYALHNFLDEYERQLRKVYIAQLANKLNKSTSQPYTMNNQKQPKIVNNPKTLIINQFNNSTTSDSTIFNRKSKYSNHTILSNKPIHNKKHLQNNAHSDNIYKNYQDSNNNSWSNQSTSITNENINGNYRAKQVNQYNKAPVNIITTINLQNNIHSDNTYNFYNSNSHIVHTIFNKQNQISNVANTSQHLQNNNNIAQTGNTLSNPNTFTNYLNHKTLTKQYNKLPNNNKINKINPKAHKPKPSSCNQAIHSANNKNNQAVLSVNVPKLTNTNQFIKSKTFDSAITNNNYSPKINHQKSQIYNKHLKNNINIVNSQPHTNNNNTKTSLIPYLLLFGHQLIWIMLTGLIDPVFIQVIWNLWCELLFWFIINNTIKITIGLVIVIARDAIGIFILIYHGAKLQDLFQFVMVLYLIYELVFMIFKLNKAHYFGSSKDIIIFWNSKNKRSLFYKTRMCACRYSLLALAPILNRIVVEFIRYKSQFYIILSNLDGMYTPFTYQ